MFEINRTAVVIKPKQPLIDWINGLPDAEDPEFTLKDFSRDTEVFLIPDQPSEKVALNYIKGLYAGIFCRLLSDICTEESWWPEKTDWPAFQEWFDLEIHSMVLDTVEDEIEREEEDCE